MEKIYATRNMIQTANDNLIETKLEKTSWGYRERKTSKYYRYFRAEIKNEILKVAIFTQCELEKNNVRPLYEVYCDKVNQTYLTYDVKNAKWRTAKIDNLEYPGMSYLYLSNNWQQDSDRARVNEYFNTGKNIDIYKAVLDFQIEIKEEQLKRKHRNEIEAIDNVMREVPNIPKNFENWIAHNCFREIMFYEPERKCRYRMQQMYCTHCRQWMDVPRYPNRPKHNEETICPKCKIPVVYKSWNKQKYVTDEIYVGLLQRLKDDTDWIIRRFKCRIIRNHEKGWEEYKMTTYEDVRSRLTDSFYEAETFEYGEYKCTGVYRWCHNARNSQFGYYYHPQIGRVLMYTPNLKRELKREKFANLDLKKVMRGAERKSVDPVFILKKLQTYPYIEYLQKSKLNKLVSEIIENKEDGSLFNKNAIKVHELLQLDKQRLNRIKELNGGSRTLTALQYERQTGNKLTNDNLLFLEENNVCVKNLIITTMRTNMNMQRTINYLQKQMFITGQNWKEIYEHYVDYLDMAELFDMDVTDEIVCRQPRLMEFHDRYLEKKNRQKNKLRDKEVDIKYKNIKANSKRYEERFKYSNKEFQIVVPKKASDITREGRLQHHCVGASDTYISNMNCEKYFILFLRRKSNLKTPYYTLEVTWDGDIKQFYAAYDRQPDKEKIRAVLENFTKTVQKREKSLQLKMHECEVRDGLKAVRIGTHYEMYNAEAI